MRLRPDQLDGHLRQPLLPLYVLTGEEPLQLAECGDLIRSAARAQGFDEREVLHAEGSFDWGQLEAASGNLSLFAARRLIEIRLPSAKPGDSGGKALAAFAAQAPADVLLLLIIGKLDSRQQKSKWFTALEKTGAIIPVWPVEAGQMPAWIGRRMKAAGLEPTAEATRLLAQRVEGNLLAAAQEIEKLRLLHGGGAIGVDAVAEAVADSARFSAFELLEAALSGDGARVVRVLDGLRGEGQEPLAILGLLIWEIRNMIAVARDASRLGLDGAFAEHKVWDKRKPLLRAALQRHGLRRWQQLLARAARIDRVAKGAEPGSPWDELLQLALLMAGVRAL